MDDVRAAFAADYRVEEEIGRGGMARVFRAKDLRNDRWVALKILRPEIASGITIQRFLLEARVSANYQHPHLLPVYDSGAAGEFVYYTMPCLEEGTLRDRLRSGTPLGEAEVVDLGKEITDALDYVHRKGQIHRDIKPENILLQGGHAYLSDFGIARAIEESKREFLTETGNVVGTSRYMSPEQASGNADLDGRSDLYSLGLVLRECLGWTASGAKSGPIDAIEGKRGDPRTTSSTRAGSTSLRLVIEKLTAASPDQRHANAAEARDALRGLQHRDFRGRWTRLGWVAASVVMGVSGYALYEQRLRSSSRSLPTTAEAHEGTIVVLPFSVHGGESNAGVSTGLASLLADALNGSGRTRAQEPQGVLEFIEREKLSTTDAEARLRILRRFGSRLYISGEAVLVGGQMRVVARLVGAGPMEGLFANASQEGTPDSLGALTDGLAIQLLAQLNARRTGEDPREGNPLRALAAVRPYVDGIDARRVGDLEAAASSFALAVQADSSFALGWYRLGQTLTQIGDRPRALEAMHRALALSQSLSPRSRLRVEAGAAYTIGNPEAARRAYRKLVDSDSDDLDAQKGLATTLSVYSIVMGWDPTSLQDVDQRILKLDPEDAGALGREFGRASAVGRAARADSIAGQMMKLGYLGADSSLFRVSRLLASGKRSEAIALTLSLRPSDPEIAARLIDCFVPRGDFEGALEALTIPNRPEQPASYRLYARIRAAWMELALGRLSSSKRRLAGAAELNPSIASIYQALDACALHLPLKEAEGRRLLDDLASRDFSEDEFAGTIAGSPYEDNEGSWTITRTYAMGLIHAALGQQAEAEASARKLEHTPGDEAARAWSSNYATGIRARLLYSEHRDREALAMLDRQINWSQPGGRIGLRTLTHERFLRIVLLERLGQREEALRWLNAFGNPSFYFDKIYETPKLLMRARILKAEGLYSEARAAYDRVATLLAKSDPEFQPLAAAAQRGVLGLDKAQPASRAKP